MKPKDVSECLKRHSVSNVFFFLQILHLAEVADQLFMKNNEKTKLNFRNTQVFA